VVLRHIHRMEPDGVQPMPNENLGKRLIEGWELAKFGYLPS
jgi:hypothetical protein